MTRRKCAPRQLAASAVELFPANRHPSPHPLANALEVWVEIGVEGSEVESNTTLGLKVVRFARLGVQGRVKLNDKIRDLR